ncbi:MAG: MarR family transcriptional regulator [Bacteroidales bacterium]|nr:MAG: MarR family transcriptional regulator [Bacteroidales bacterium]
MKKQSIEEVRAFNRVYTVFMGILNKSYLESDFSLVETRVMHTAINKDGIMPSEIVALLNIDKSYLSRIITSLEKRKVITKNKSSSDGRSIRLSITEYGKKEFEKLNQASDIQVEGLLSQLSAKDCERLVKNMSEIRDILEKK